MKIIAIYSIKGGVGKTATSVNLAYLAGRGGASSLLCDLDPQGAASFYFRVQPGKKFSRKHLLHGGKELNRNIKETAYDNLDVLPSDFSYRNLDVSLGEGGTSKKKMAEVFNRFSGKYEYLFLDCPPNITLVSENIFRAADHLLVPCIPTTLSILTFVKLVKFFKEKGLDLGKIKAFFSMVEQRKRMHQDSIEKVRKKKVPYFLKSQIPYLADIEKMGVMRGPVASFAPQSVSAEAYERLWREIKASIA